MAFGSGCAMLTNPVSERREATPVESTRTSPDTAARVPVPAALAGGNVYAFNSANCMRDWARPECQDGTAAPESNDPQPASGSSSESSPQPARGALAAIALGALIFTLAVVIGTIAGNAIMSGAF
jgi:hypothetical protein